MFLGHAAVDTAPLLSPGVTLFLDCPAASCASLVGAGRRGLGISWWKCLEEVVEFLGMFSPTR